MAFNSEIQGLKRGKTQRKQRPAASLFRSVKKGLYLDLSTRK